MKLMTDSLSDDRIQELLGEFCDAIAAHIMGWPQAHKLAWGARQATPQGRLEFMIKPQAMQAQLEQELRADQGSYMVATIIWEQGHQAPSALQIHARAYEGTALTTRYQRSS